MNVGNPELAFDFQRLPNAGIGLARLEFIIARMIGVHPKAVLAYPEPAARSRREIETRSGRLSRSRTFYVDKLTEGIATLGAAFSPKPVIVRLSDFKSNEYSSLIGGKQYEPEEENPMLGFRGASRYIDPSFRDCFELECRALKKVRDEMGLTNVEIMVPFVRTVSEASQVIELLAENGLKRGQNGLRVIMMCEIPSNALLADQFLRAFRRLLDRLQRHDPVDARPGPGLRHRRRQVRRARSGGQGACCSMAIQACRKAGKYVGICGQGPSDHPDLAEWLMEQGIDAISLNPDTVVETWLFLAREAREPPRPDCASRAVAPAIFWDACRLG